MLLRTRAVPTVDVCWNDVVDLCGMPSWQALVYDLHPWDQRALQLMSTLSAVAPAIPALLYVPHVPGVERLLEQCLGARRLLKLQFADAEEPERLARELDRLRRSVPCEELLCQLRASLPSVPARPWAFIEEGVRRVAHGNGDLHENTGMVASSMGISMRTLERSFRDVGLPGPKEMLNWLALLYITLWAQRSGCSPAQIARALDQQPNDIYRLRHRLLHRRCAFMSSAAGDTSHFDSVLRAFLARCRPSETAGNQRDVRRFAQGVMQ